MRALTVNQPYADAIVKGIKKYETRSRRTNIRGRVAIHAGKKILKSPGLFRRLWELLGGDTAQYGGSWLHHLESGVRSKRFGAVIGTVEIVDCVPIEEIVDKLSETERLLGDYSPGRFAWVLKNPRKFSTTIPARGQLGFWEWTPPEGVQDMSERVKIRYTGDAPFLFKGRAYQAERGPNRPDGTPTYWIYYRGYINISGHECELVEEEKTE